MRSGFLIGEAIIGVPSTNVLVVVLSKSFLLMLGKLLVVFEVVVKVAELASSFSILIPISSLLRRDKSSELRKFLPIAA